MDYTSHFSTTNTPQSQPIPGRNMVKNEADGYGFASDKWELLDRFLILGTEGGSYYVGEKELTIQNAQNLLECLKESGESTVEIITRISESGRAPKNNAAIFALAVACAFGNEVTKRMAQEAITKVCRTSTHLFQFCQDYKKLGKTNRSMKRAIASFYTKKDASALAYQLVKYRQRNGWTHKDVIHLSHPKLPKDDIRHGLINFALGKEYVTTSSVVIGYERLKSEPEKAVSIISEYHLPWEAVPTELLAKREVWEALLPTLPYTALIRNLGRLSSLGICGSNLADATLSIANRISHPAGIEYSRIHPFSLLLAYATYRQGHGEKGKLSWSVSSNILEALEKAFYVSFKNVEPTGKNILVAVDSSGSMTGAKINKTSISAAQAAFLMGYITRRIESKSETVLFDTQLHSCPLANASLGELLDYAQRNFHGGGTNCDLPFAHALHHKIKVDAFVIYTDSQSWYGDEHPIQAFNAYTKHYPSKMIVAEMTATKTTIADKLDKRCLSIVGMDASVPTLINDFIKK